LRRARYNKPIQLNAYPLVPKLRLGDAGADTACGRSQQELAGRRREAELRDEEARKGESVRHSERSGAKSRNLSFPRPGQKRCLDKLGMTKARGGA